MRASGVRPDAHSRSTRSALQVAGMRRATFDEELFPRALALLVSCLRYCVLDLILQLSRADCNGRHLTVLYFVIGVN